MLRAQSSLHGSRGRPLASVTEGKGLDAIGLAFFLSFFLSERARGEVTYVDLLRHAWAAGEER
jgi:hypothetical protein